MMNTVTRAQRAMLDYIIKHRGSNCYWNCGVCPLGAKCVVEIAMAEKRYQAAVKLTTPERILELLL